MEQRINSHYRIFFKIFAIGLILNIASCSSINIEAPKEGGLNNAIIAAAKDYSGYASATYPDVFSYYVNIKEVDRDFFSFSVVPSSIVRFNKSQSIKKQDLEKLPTDYIEIEGRLYSWWSDGNTAELNDLEVFKNFGLMIEDKDAYGMYTERNSDELRKITYYYFCKQDLRINAKVLSNKNANYFIIPEDLRCTQLARASRS
jgi:hypothetical protein